MIQPVATLENGRLERQRAEGKLKNLEAKLAAAPLSGSIGVGHTRWATHGKPTETNAHPHASRGLAVVHNGIIENYKALRDELAAKGHASATETDSEIAAFVVEDELAKGKSPAEAVHAALKRLRGAFALVYKNEVAGVLQKAQLSIEDVRRRRSRARSTLSNDAVDGVGVLAALQSVSRPTPASWPRSMHGRHSETKSAPLSSGAKCNPRRH
jgi:Glutamine amidotransferase domain